jgi:hypothetical protein
MLNYRKRLEKAANSWDGYENLTKAVLSNFGSVSKEFTEVLLDQVIFSVPCTEFVKY